MVKYAAKNVFTFFFLILALLAAIRIPVRAAIYDPIFDHLKAKEFLFTPEEKNIFRTEGLSISNIEGNHILYPIIASESNTIYDLKLTFDGSDYLNNYQVIRSSFDTNNIQKISGTASAKFLGRNEGIVLTPNHNSILVSKLNGIQNMSIEFDLYAYRSGEGTQVIFAYEGKNIYDKYDTNGTEFSIEIEKGQVIYRFTNSFKDYNDKRYSFVLYGPNLVKEHHWENYAVSIDVAQSIIRTYKNGILESVQMITDNNLETGLRLIPVIQENPENYLYMVKIGQNGSFSLDNLKIYSGARTNFGIQVPNQEAFLETEVFQISTNNSFLKTMAVQVLKDRYTHYRIAYRFDKTYFPPELSSEKKPWIYIDPDRSKFPSSFAQGRFLQWRFEYFGPPIPKSPLENLQLKSIQASYIETINPGSVSIDQLEEGDRKITVFWETVPNPLIESYEIYYGTSPNDYFGKSSISPHSPIVFKSLQYSKSEQLAYTIEGLDNERPYFIAIRAKDIYGQYGQFSQEVYARPSSTKTKTGYSIGR